MGQVQSTTASAAPQGVKATSTTKRAISERGPQSQADPIASDHLEHVRKLSVVSNRNIQLLSMKPRSERDNYADSLLARRRSSLINMILGAPSSGPRFSDDLCSLSSHMSDLCQNFGIDYFPDGANGQQKNPLSKLNSTSSSLARFEEGACYQVRTNELQEFQRGYLTHHRRRSSLGSLVVEHKPPVMIEDDGNHFHKDASRMLSASSKKSDAFDDHGTHQDPKVRSAVKVRGERHPSLASTLMASIDLTSSMERPDEAKIERSAQCENLCAMGDRHDSIGLGHAAALARYEAKTMGRFGDGSSGDSASSLGLHTNVEIQTDNGRGAGCARLTSPKERINQTVTTRRMLHRSGSELSLYSSISASSMVCGCGAGLTSHKHQHNSVQASLSERRASRCSNASSMVVNGCCGVGGSSKIPSARLGKSSEKASELVRETKLIIMLQVCLPFILAGFGNMAAGLVLNKVAQWKAFQHVPIFFVLLPSFIGLKGNIEMTLASRLSTLANLNLLTTGHQKRHAYLSNLILILSQAIGLSLFGAFASMLCEYSMGKLEFSLEETLYITSLVVLPCALVTSVVLVFISSIVMWFAIWLANLIRVNPDNLSTLLAALYGDVSCVLTYGLFAELMYSFHRENILLWPLVIICTTILAWPILWYVAFKFRETRELALSSMPPMLTGIVVSLGSGTVLSLVVGRFSRIALYQPVVNGFGANLIAVQASRVSTWLWCGALRRMSSATDETIATDQASKSDVLRSDTGKTSRDKLGTSLATFTSHDERSNKRVISAVAEASDEASSSLGQLAMAKLSRAAGLALKLVRLFLWSFVNSSPNSVAARLLLIMLVPAHTLYFFVIWLLSPSNYVVITWAFYAIYIALCLTQVFILLLVCEPLMTLLMRRHLDPDIFGISLLMALADLVGTLCLTAAFWLLAHLNDPNAY